MNVRTSAKPNALSGQSWLIYWYAARFGFSVATMRHWERGERSPGGASSIQD
jgi:hypothetical protein